jgi:hypothetical protein
MITSNASVFLKCSSLYSSCHRELITADPLLPLTHSWPFSNPCLCLCLPYGSESLVGALRTRDSATEYFLFRLPEVNAYESAGGLPLFAGLTQNGELVLNISLLFG